MLAIYVLLATAAGANLASPLNLRLFDYLKSLINVNNHTAAYFIGIRARPVVYWKQLDNRTSTTPTTVFGAYNLPGYAYDVRYSSVEGRSHDSMPTVVHDAIGLLNITQGECLSMDRHGIHSVSCKAPLPFICYSKETEECGSAPTTQASTTQAPKTQAPTMQALKTQAPTMQAPKTQAPTTHSPTTQAPTTQAPTTQAPKTQAPVYTCYKAREHAGSCYKLYERFMAWDSAKAVCAKDGAQLLVLDDAEEAKLVERIIKDAGGPYYSVWVGLRDNRPQGVMDWRTVDGKPLSDMYHEWGEGEPENEPRNNCAYFYAYDRRLHDASCDNTIYFICEILKK